MTAFSESQPELDILLGEIAASGLGAVTSRGRVPRRNPEGSLVCDAAGAFYVKSGRFYF